MSRNSTSSKYSRILVFLKNGKEIKKYWDHELSRVIKDYKQEYVLKNTIDSTLTFFFIDMYDIEKRFLTEMLKLKFTKKKKNEKNDGYLPEQEFWAFELE